MPVIVICACFGLVSAALRIVFHGTESAGIVGLIGDFVLVPSILAALIIAMINDSRSKPQRLVVMRGGFGVPHPRAASLGALLFFAAAGKVAAHAINSWRDGVYGFWSRPPAVLLLIALSMSVIVFSVVLSGPAVLLTPTGIIIRERGLRRTVPWTALAPEAPLCLIGLHIELSVARPEEVRQFGLPLGNGSRARSKILAERADARLLADAIHWYVERPEKRPSIGTQAGFDALMADLHPLTALR